MIEKLKPVKLSLEQDQKIKEMFLKEKDEESEELGEVTPLDVSRKSSDAGFQRMVTAPQGYEPRKFVQKQYLPQVPEKVKKVP